MWRNLYNVLAWKLSEPVCSAASAEISNALGAHPDPTASSRYFSQCSWFESGFLANSLVPPNHQALNPGVWNERRLLYKSDWWVRGWGGGGLLLLLWKALKTKKSHVDVWTAYHPRFYTDSACLRQVLDLCLVQKGNAITFQSWGCRREGDPFRYRPSCVCKATSALSASCVLPLFHHSLYSHIRCTWCNAFLLLESLGERVTTVCFNQTAVHQPRAPS